MYTMYQKFKMSVNRNWFSECMRHSLSLCKKAGTKRMTALEVRILRTTCLYMFEQSHDVVSEYEFVNIMSFAVLNAVKLSY